MVHLSIFWPGSTETSSCESRRVPRCEVGTIDEYTDPSDRHTTKERLGISFVNTYVVPKNNEETREERHPESACRAQTSVYIVSVASSYNVQTT